MALPRHIRPATSEQVTHLTLARLPAYRKKLLSLENNVAESDCRFGEAEKLDKGFIWLKEDARWREQYD